jgi:hypothetical protein
MFTQRQREAVYRRGAQKKQMLRKMPVRDHIEDMHVKE